MLHHQPVVAASTSLLYGDDRVLYRTISHRDLFSVSSRLRIRMPVFLVEDEIQRGRRFSNLEREENRIRRVFLRRVSVYERDCAWISRIGARVRDKYTLAALAEYRCARRAAAADARRSALQVRSRPYLLSASARRIIDLAVDLNWRRIGDVYWFTITPIDRTSFAAWYVCRVLSVRRHSRFFDRYLSPRTFHQAGAVRMLVI